MIILDIPLEKTLLYKSVVEYLKLNNLYFPKKAHDITSCALKHHLPTPIHTLALIKNNIDTFDLKPTDNKTRGIKLFNTITCIIMEKLFSKGMPYYYYVADYWIKDKNNGISFLELLYRKLETYGEKIILDPISELASYKTLLSNLNYYEYECITNLQDTIRDHLYYKFLHKQTHFSKEYITI